MRNASHYWVAIKAGQPSSTGRLRSASSRSRCHAFQNQLDRANAAASTHFRYAMWRTPIITRCWASASNREQLWQLHEPWSESVSSGIWTLCSHPRPLYDVNFPSAFTFVGVKWCEERKSICSHFTASGNTVTALLIFAWLLPAGWL